MKKLIYQMANKYQPETSFIDILDPENNQPFARVPALSPSDVDYAFKSAHLATKQWAELSITQRAKYLNRWCELLLKHKEELAETLVTEIAKPYNDALTEVIRSCEYISYTVEEMYRLEITARSSEQYYGHQADKVAITSRIPVGVVLAISPFNYPINLAISKIAPALISGNTVVFKPATQGSVAAIRIYELFLQTGAPAGVFNLVTGRGSEIGDYLITSNQADMISFTGGTTVGTNISQLASMTPHVLELGGKDAAIILDEEDLDLDFITKDIVSGAFSYSGQRCTAIKRVLIPSRLYEQVATKLANQVEQLTVGSALTNCDITAVIDSKSADNIQSLVVDASIKGATFLTKFDRTDNLITPVLVTNVTDQMRIYAEEPFGPILPLIVYQNLEDAIAIHNDSEYGLQVSVYGTDINNILAISSKLEAATVNVNGKTSRGPDNFSFSGFKQSGLGVQGIYDSILSMTKPKSIAINIRDK